MEVPFGASATRAVQSAFAVQRAARGGGFLSSLGGKIKSVGQAFGIGGRPTFADIAKNTAKIGAASGLAYYASTGELPKFSARTIAGFGGAQLSFPGAIVGAIQGLGSTAKNKIVDSFTKKYTDGFAPNMSVPGAITQSEMDLALSKLKINTPSLNTDNVGDLLGSGINIYPGTSPLSGGIPSGFDVNVQGSGGMGDEMKMLILALLGGGALGYFAGRKRKKKKKKKNYSFLR